MVQFMIMEAFCHLYNVFWGDILSDCVVLKAKESICTINAVKKLILSKKYTPSDINLSEKEGKNIITIKCEIFQEILTLLSEYIFLDYIIHFTNNLSKIKPLKSGFFSKILIKSNLMEKTGINNQIIKKIHIFKRLYNEISIDGIILFATREYDDILSDIIDSTINEILAEEELIEFIDMLKFYIATEPIEFGTLNIDVQSDGTYRYYDKEYNDITKEWFEAFFNETLDVDASEDEILISTLVTRHPQEIIIHNVHNTKNRKLLRTIKSVFERRVKLCSADCHLCQS